MPRAETVTILFTDLVSSTELLERAGDEDAQRIFQAHHRLLRDVVGRHGGQEVKWLGDGLMVAFSSATQAMRCAVEMQQMSRRPAAGERLHIRVGLHVGEALRDESDYFGTAVVIARRLCDSGDGGAIRASSLAAQLVSDRAEFDFEDLGALTLKGISAPVPACEVKYEHDPLAMLAETPFVGRDDVIALLAKKLEATRAGSGGLTMLVGEPGIGKTRAAEEFIALARHRGATVLRGSCYDGGWAPPFSPFVEAIRTYASTVPADRLAAELGADADVLARIVPALHEHLPEIAEPTALSAEGERYRLLEAASNFLTRIASAAPVVLLLDDLHWADKGTIAMLRQVARVAPGHELLVIGAYRDVELDRAHPLAEALAALRRETQYERIVLKGLEASDVGELLGLVAEQRVPEEFAQTISDETGGNPFFIREVMLHLVEEKKIVQEDGRWISAGSIADIRIPEGVREVIGRRLSRLSDGCNRMLTAASAMSGGWTWHEIRAISDGRDESELLDALDDALHAQLIRETTPSTYDFVHALIRHTLYDRLSTPRRAALHRQIGEALESLYAADIEPHLAELAHHLFEASDGGDSATAIRYLTRAGEGSVRRLAYEDAVVHFERAPAMETDDRNRCELLLSLASASGRAGMASRAKATFELAGDVALRLASPESLARAALETESLSADAGVNVRIIEAALAALPPGDSVARARCLARLAPSSGGDERAGELSRQAVEMARRLGDKRALAHGLNSTYRYLVDSSPLNGA